MVSRYFSFRRYGGGEPRRAGGSGGDNLAGSSDAKQPIYVPREPFASRVLRVNGLTFPPPRARYASAEGLPPIRSSVVTGVPMSWSRDSPGNVRSHDE